jgi:RsmE family RNA methyltransferase
VNLIILEAGEVGESGEVTLRDARAAHLRHVLKATPGQPIRIGLLDGPLGTAIVSSSEREHVSMSCTFEGTVPERPRVDLLLALPRPKVLRRLWAQLAALGVGQIILTNAERVERNYFDTHVLAPACYRPLLVEGLQQARDTRLPSVSVHRQFRVLVEDDLDSLFGDGLRLVADPRATTTARDTLRSHAGRRVLAAVGPEGGWNEFELRMLERHGFELVGMGRRTLRTDTACIAMLGVLHDALNG